MTLGCRKLELRKMETKRWREIYHINSSLLVKRCILRLSIHQLMPHTIKVVEEEVHQQRNLEKHQKRFMMQTKISLMSRRTTKPFILKRDITIYRMTKLRKNWMNLNKRLRKGLKLLNLIIILFFQGWLRNKKRNCWGQNLRMICLMRVVARNIHCKMIQNWC